MRAFSTTYLLHFEKDKKVSRNKVVLQCSIVDRLHLPLAIPHRRQSQIQPHASILRTLQDGLLGARSLRTWGQKYFRAFQRMSDRLSQAWCDKFSKAEESESANDCASKPSIGK
jgi:hypothetical protein